MKVGDLVRFSSKYRRGGKKRDALMMIVGIHPTAKGLVRYWHPRFGDGGWAGKETFMIVSKVGNK